MFKIRLFLIAFLLMILLSAACGDDDSDELDAVDRQTEIGQTLDAAEGSEVTVSGFLVVDRDGNALLCSGLLESFPPQCGGDRIKLLEFDANSVPNTSNAQSSSEIQTAKWTNIEITVTGIKGVGGLSNVRLSNGN